MADVAIGRFVGCYVRSLVFANGGNHGINESIKHRINPVINAWVSTAIESFRDPKKSIDFPTYQSARQPFYNSEMRIRPGASSDRQHRKRINRCCSLVGEVDDWPIACDADGGCEN